MAHLLSNTMLMIRRGTKYFSKPKPKKEGFRSLAYTSSCPSSSKTGKSIRLSSSIYQVYQKYLVLSTFWRERCHLSTVKLLIYTTQAKYIIEMRWGNLWLDYYQFISLYIFHFDDFKTISEINSFCYKTVQL